MQTSFFGETLDLTNTAPATEYVPLPAGVYPAALIDCEVLQKPHGISVKAKFKVVDGPSNGKTFLDTMILIHRNSPQAHDIAQRRMRSWCDAIGVSPNVTSMDPFIGKTVNVKLRIDPPREHEGKQYSASNRIESFSAYGAVAPANGQPAPVPRPVAPVAPAAVAQTQSVAQAAHPATGTQEKRMPWQK